MADDPEARVAVRDRLLDAIVGHLDRRGDPHFAELCRRIIGLVRDNDGRIDESRLGAEIAMFAEMDLSRGKMHAPYVPLDDAVKKTWVVEGCLRAHLRDLAGQDPLVRLARGEPELTDSEMRRLDDPRQVPRETCTAAVRATWAECFPGRPSLNEQELRRVSRGKAVGSMAVRLTWNGLGIGQGYREYDDFRRSIARHKVRPNPWTVDRRSAT